MNALKGYAIIAVFLLLLIVLCFKQMEWIASNERVSAFDLIGNCRIDFADIVMLFGEI